MNHRQFLRRRVCIFVLFIVVLPGLAAELPLRVSWGNQSASKQAFHLQLLTNDVTLTSPSAIGFELGDRAGDAAIITTAGAGDVDAVELRLRYPEREVSARTNIQSIWRYLLDHSDLQSASRLRNDPAFRPDPRQVTFQLNEAGTRGFTLTVDQLLSRQCFWVPDLDLFIATGDQPESFEEHQQQHEHRGARILDRVRDGPEATYAEFTNRWEDMGNPAYKNPAAPEPGHIVCVTWPGALHKFGIDRWAGVRNDLGNPEHFRFQFEFGSGAALSAPIWKRQTLADGLPVLVTAFESDAVRYEIEQFACPLNLSGGETSSDVRMVLLQRLRLTNLGGEQIQVPVTITHSRECPPSTDLKVLSEPEALVWRETGKNLTWLTLQSSGFAVARDSQRISTNRVSARTELKVDLAPNGRRELIIKLPSPILEPPVAASLLAMDYEKARKLTLGFWNDSLESGARFEVPEPVVNELFRANLWHARRLPRRHPGEPGKMDLPYSNFAYGQEGTPWPINQAVYVDYMLYDLRGYHRLAAEELRAMFANNQETNGHVRGFANWGVYTPGMLYAVAQNFLLSGDRESFESLLPQSLKALDWCLAEMKAAEAKQGPVQGLVMAPLNDLSHEPRAWAFNQAYLFAGTELFGRALASIDHPKANECFRAAATIRDAVERGFGRATMRAPLVPLRDDSWSPYVPCDALNARRLPEIWYPTDVDCGALHLSRLEALDPAGWLTTALLNDHEDNLFLNSWGMANEPVYNQQATAYLLRDEPKAVIRAFYSMMACAFSHSVLEPVEHRWAWGQYFGPPSTDGAWFELYRRMLIQERKDGALLLLQATPRAWLEPGKQIVVHRAPTYYGPLSMWIESRLEAAEIAARIKLSGRKQPGKLVLRLRSPGQRPIRSVRVNGESWAEFDSVGESVSINQPSARSYEIQVRY